MLAAAHRSGRATGAITVVPDAAIEAVVATWPGRWKTDRATALGLPADSGLDAIVDEYLASI
jgi:hypothetical protein